MSAVLGWIPRFLSVTLVIGLLSAQEKPKTADELRRENAALRQQVEKLQIQLAAAKGGGGTQVRPAAEPSHFSSDAIGSLRAYELARSALVRATTRLMESATLAQTRRLLDTIERRLLDLRRAVWFLRQARLAGAPGSTGWRTRVQVPDLSAPTELDLGWPLLSVEPGEKLFFSFRRF